MAAVSMMAYSARESFHAYPQQQLGAYQTAPQEPRSYPSHAPNSNSPYPTHHTQTQQHPQPQPQPPPQQQQQHFGHHRSSSASSSSWPVERPAGDSSKPSLPGIASLLNVADGDRARTNHANSPPLSRHFHDRGQVLPDRPAYPLHALDRKPSPPSRPPWLESATSPRQTPDLAHTAVPTPLPFRHSSAGDRARSPSTHSTGSAASIPPRHSAGAVGSIEPGAPRPEPMHGVQSSPVPAQLAASPRSKPAVSPYLATVNNPPRYPVAYPSPETPTPAASDDLYQQRPLPPNFPPHAVAPAAVQAENGPTSNPWQHHHHYISNSAHATFPPSQDRYICPTCQKAFSRPSSLKIHCHSHTGEKPFRCPHAGCGKAFSVRSNMKRHERGCHSGIGFAPGDDVSMIDQ